MWVLWIFIIILSAFLDIITLDFLFSGIYIAAFSSLIMYYLGVNAFIQLIIFGILSFFIMFCIYPIIKRCVSNDK